jgi:hypothetical protein
LPEPTPGDEKSGDSKESVDPTVAKELMDRLEGDGAAGQRPRVPEDDTGRQYQPPRVQRVVLRVEYLSERALSAPDVFFIFVVTNEFQIYTHRSADTPEVDETLHEIFTS